MAAVIRSTTDAWLTTSKLSLLLLVHNWLLAQNCLVQDWCQTIVMQNPDSAMTGVVFQWCPTSATSYATPKTLEYTPFLREHERWYLNGIGHFISIFHIPQYNTRPHEGVWSGSPLSSGRGKGSFHKKLLSSKPNLHEAEGFVLAFCLQDLCLQKAHKLADQPTCEVRVLHVSLAPWVHSTWGHIEDTLLMKVLSPHTRF